MATSPRVSVLLVTKNGERYLAEVLDNIRAQQGPFCLEEIIAVDSGSRDGSLDILERYGVTVIPIPPHEFSHGKTRNLAASHARGDYLAFLTQDATPANADWLAKLLEPFSSDPCIVGAYSRHQPRPACHPMEWRRLVEEELSGMSDSRVNSCVDNPDYAKHPAFFYFFANVSSLIRRDIWAEFPFPEVEFAEDQLWAKQVLEAGYKTAYQADSVVFHSHSYGPWTNFCRHFDHVAALAHAPGQVPQTKLAGCVPTALRFTQKDVAFWSHYRQQRKTQVLRRWALPAMSWHLAARFGIWLGERASHLPDWVCRQLSLQERTKRK